MQRGFAVGVRSLAGSVCTTPSLSRARRDPLGPAPLRLHRRLAAALCKLMSTIQRCHSVLIISLDVNFNLNSSMDFSKTLNVSGYRKTSCVTCINVDSGVKQLGFVKNCDIH